MIERPDVFETVKTKSDFDKLIKDANAGEPKAEFLLGECYRTGHFINYSNSSALKWYTLAAEHGCAIAQHKVGRNYLYGRGVEKNQAEGLKWIRLAAMQGYVAAQLSLAIAYNCGNGVEQNYEEALKWYTLAAEHGDTQAQIRIGEFYYNGLGVEQNYEEAVKYFRLAGDRAIDKLADCYLRGHGVERSVEKAIELLKSNALGNQSLCMKLAHLYSDGIEIEHDIIEAARWWYLAASNGRGDLSCGNSEALYNLGFCFYEGLGAAQDDKLALLYFKYAVDNFQTDMPCPISEEPEYVINARRMLVKLGDKSMISNLKRAAKNGSEKANEILKEFGIEIIN